MPRNARSDPRGHAPHRGLSCSSCCCRCSSPYTGLQNEHRGCSDRLGAGGWITLGLIGIAIVGKLAGAAIASRVRRLRLAGLGGDRHAHEHPRTDRADRAQPRAVSGGAISNALYAALVLMALVTTFMAAPILRLAGTATTHGKPVEEAFEGRPGERTRRDFPSISSSPRPLAARRAADSTAALTAAAALGQAAGHSPSRRARSSSRGWWVPPRGGRRVGRPAGSRTSAVANARRAAQLRLGP